MTGYRKGIFAAVGGGGSGGGGGGVVVPMCLNGFDENGVFEAGRKPLSGTGVEER